MVFVGKVALSLAIVLLVVVPVGSIGFEASTVYTFVSPDSATEGFNRFIDTVDGSLYLSAYTISNPSVAHEILELLRNGKKVIIIVEDSPVGGYPEDELGILTILKHNGAEVYFDGDRYRFSHGKYAISDNDTLYLSTENLGRNGLPPSGSKGNRGWGAVIEDPEATRYFLDVFFTDLKYSHLFDRENYKINQSLDAESYDVKFPIEKFKGAISVTPVLAPDDSVQKIISLINSANESIYIEQFYVYKYWGSRKSGSAEKTPNLFLEAAINAARRGVKVRILLDETWYVNERGDPVSNFYTIRYVNEVSRVEGLDMEAKIIDCEKLGIEKLHNKGLIVDEKMVLISSINWNENSPRNNREVGLIIEGEPAQYFAQVFLFDWAEGKTTKSNGSKILVLMIFSLGVTIYLWFDLDEKD